MLNLPQEFIYRVVPAEAHAFGRVHLVFNESVNLTPAPAEPYFCKRFFIKVAVTKALVAEEITTGINASVREDLRNKGQPQALLVFGPAVILEIMPTDD